MKTGKFLFSISICLVLSILFFAGSVTAKSLYVIDAINSNPTSISAYNINADSTLTLQATSTVPRYAGGAVGLSAFIEVDGAGEPTGEGTLFVTYEFSNLIQLIDAKTMISAGSIAVSGASNMAGIVYDSKNDLLYAVDRQTNNLYVYAYDFSTTTLTLQGSYNLTGAYAFGIALDEKNGLLYIANYSQNITIYDISDWSLSGSITVANRAISVAVDVENGFVFSGGGWGSNYYLDKYDLADDTTSSVYIAYYTGVMGLGVDLDTGYVYCTTGYFGDDLRVYSSDLTLLQNVGTIGNSPTGLVIPAGDVGFNPLNLSKADDVDPVTTGENLTYTICFDNVDNTSDVEGVVITDDIPADTSFVSATGPFSFDGTTVEWNVGLVAAGSNGACYQLVVNVTASGGSVISNQCTIDSDDTPPTTKTETTDVIDIELCGDLDSDGDVDGDDRNILRGAFRTCEGDPGFIPEADYDEDGCITFSDYREWYKCYKAFISPA